MQASRFIGSILTATLFSLIFTGCSTYIPPGPKADLNLLAPASIREGFDRKPTTPFPASILAIRIQGPSYSNYYLSRQGRQQSNTPYSIIHTREIEDESDIAKISALPQVAGLASVNRLILPEAVKNEEEIRAAASRIQADMIFLYTFDTVFIDVQKARPLSVITLGLSPTRKIDAVTTVSALLIDTRTGYVYSVYEQTERQSTLATSWGSNDAADEIRRENEKVAFKKLVTELCDKWPSILSRYLKK